MTSASTSIRFRARRACLVLGAAASLAGMLPARAADWPERTVTIIVPYAAGGGTDTVARALARTLESRWKQPVVVENLGGADGIIGTRRALAQPADGYTLVLQLNSMFLWRPAETSGRDLVGDMKLLSIIQTAPLSFAVSSAFAGNTMQDFAAHCRTTPCSIGSATRYARLIATHLMAEANVPGVAQISYKGGGPMTTDLLGGHVTMAVPSVAAAQRYVEAGQMKLLAVGSAQRFPIAPQVKTLEEQGLAVYGDSWYGLMTRKGLPPKALAAIEEGIRAASQDAALEDLIRKGGGQPVFSSADAFEALARKERAYLEPLVARYPMAD